MIEEPSPPSSKVSEDEQYILTFPDKYHNDDPTNSTVVSETVGNNGKIITHFENGKKMIKFNNGV